MGTKSLSPGVKQLGHEANHSPPSSADVKTVWSHIPLFLYVFMVVMLNGQYANISVPQVSRMHRKYKFGSYKS